MTVRLCVRVHGFQIAKKSLGTVMESQLAVLCWAGLGCKSRGEGGIAGCNLEGVEEVSSTRRRT